MGIGRFGVFPREIDFFVLFDRNARHLVEAAQVLVQALEHPETLDRQAGQLKDLEHAADEVTHQVMAGLNLTFVTPIDRSDIADLAHALDDMMDFMEAALTRMLLFKLRQPTALAQELARIILQQAEVINRGVPLLRHEGDRPRIHDCLVEVNRLENAGDRLLERALATLYDQPADLTGIIDRLKWREVYELLEIATDRAEDVANVLEGIVLKNA